jgi:hypothetical protein
MQLLLKQHVKPLKPDSQLQGHTSCSPAAVRAACMSCNKVFVWFYKMQVWKTEYKTFVKLTCSRACSPDLSQGILKYSREVITVPANTTYQRARFQMHKIRSFIWWFPCQKYRAYTKYAWLWTTLHVIDFGGVREVHCVHSSLSAKLKLPCILTPAYNHHTVDS